MELEWNGRATLTLPDQGASRLPQLDSSALLYLEISRKALEAARLNHVNHVCPRNVKNASLSILICGDQSLL
jgi:hypothetical protein